MLVLCSSGVTLSPLAPTYFTSSNHVTSWPAGDQLVALRGVTHISCPHKNTIEGARENRTNEQTRTMLGVNSEQKESMQHYISVSIYGLTLAWITSENSTKQLECRHLDSIFFAGPYLLCWCHLSGVRCQLPLSVVPRQLSSSFVQPTLFSHPVTSSGHAEISSPKTLCLVSRQNRQRNRLLGGPPIWCYIPPPLTLVIYSQ